MNIVRKKKWMIAIAMVVVMAAMTFSLVGTAAKGKEESVDTANKITYVLELEGNVYGEFTNLDAPNLETEIIEYQDGDDLTIRKRPGRTRVSNLVIRTGLANPVLDDLWTWYSTVLAGRVDRKSGSIIVLDGHGEEIDRYNIFYTWPCGWSVVTLQEEGEKDTVVVEIEIAVEQVVRMQ